MDDLRLLRERFLGFLPCVLALVVYLVLLVALVGAVLVGPLTSSMLTLLLIPIVLTAFVYSRRLTLATIALGTLAAIWLALRISSDFRESVWTIGLSVLAAVILTETIRAVLRHRERAEAALARERDFAESLLAAAPMMICVLDRDLRVIRMNQFAEAITGYPLEVACSTDWIHEWVPSDMREIARTFLRDALVEPNSIEQGRVLPLIAQNGSLRDIQWYVRIIPDLLEGQPGIIALGQDVTDRLRAAYALRASEMRYRRLVENLGEGIGIADPDETFVFANPAAEGIFGVPPGDLVGRNVREFTDDEVFARVRRGTEARARGESGRYELAIRRPDGDVRHLLLNVVPNTADDGTFIGSMGIFLDITARREAEASLRNLNEDLEAEVAERTADLRAERARLQAILNSVADGLVVVDAEGRITLENPVASRWLTEVLPPSDAEVLRETIQSMAVGDAAGDAERTLALRGLDLRLQAAPIGEGADDAAAVVSIHDVTALKQVSRIKSRFIEDVSHELRTPTSAIKLYADLLSKAPGARRETYQAALVAEAEQLTRLVEDILQLNSIESSVLQDHARPWNLNEIVRQHEEEFCRVAEVQGLSFDLELAETPPRVQVDVNWLIDALSRLVDNAALYTPPGGSVTIRAGSAVAEGRQWATLAVVDTGVGIPEEDLPHIFERFYRGDYARDQQISGTGLGLPIVREIAKLHGGRVTTESEASKGSTFTIWLPIQGAR
jgi:two-component system, OmpR family, phosphate regulon sensor histidine kinase PhoR